VNKRPTKRRRGSKASTPRARKAFGKSRPTEIRPSGDAPAARPKENRAIKRPNDLGRRSGAVRAATDSHAGEQVEGSDWWARRDPTAAHAALAAIVDSSDDAIISKDLDGTILTWNRGAERTFGYRQDEVVGKSITILLPPERLHEEASILESLRRGDRIDHFETERVTKDGRTLQISLSVSPIVDGRGRVIGAAKIARDITVAREAELLRSRVAAIVDSADDAIVGKDLNGIIISWNAAAERVFGYTADEVVGKSILILLPAERHAEEARVLATLRRGERIDHFETVRVRKDGRRIEVSLSVSPIRDASGRVVGAAKIARDVTARKRGEQERERLLAREQAARAVAEAATRAKDAFLAMVSHELRTPLSPILAWTRMLREGTLGADKTARALETIERNVRTQTQLIGDLLDISRIVAGKLRLQVRPLALSEVIERAIEVVRVAADAKGVRIQAVLDTETGPISGDPDRLQQVLWNLLSNAIKFTPRDGRVQIVLERVNSQVEIAVRDTGQGIKAEFLPYLFDPFRQAESGPDRMHGGLGLGLAIVRHIVELHGGSIVAESEGQGQGATFRLQLPRTPVVRTDGERERRHPTLEDTMGPALEGARLSGLRVLVVDDEPDSNDVVSTILASAGAEVRVAGSVAGAMEELVQWSPTVLVSDIGMPGEDGYALIRKVRALDGAVARIPAVALTAYTTADDRIRIFSSGFQGHVAKPVEPAELVAVIQSVGSAGA
jgi:PAS domain S-box-containing protein